MFKFIKMTARVWFLLGFISCLVMLIIGAFFQLIMDLKPCPLCISQRIAILVLGVVFLIATLHNPLTKGINIYALLATLVALIGGLISARHIWIQNMPANEIPECGPGLSYMFDHFPLIESLKFMLSGTGDCAKTLWTFLGLSIPSWTLVAFILLAGMSLLQLSTRQFKFCYRID
jgi:disulfide bond formation protein DsbB